jgi:hypothetical protein
MRQCISIAFSCDIGNVSVVWGDVPKTKRNVRARGLSRPNGLMAKGIKRVMSLGGGRRVRIVFVSAAELPFLEDLEM